MPDTRALNSDSAILPIDYMLQDTSVSFLGLVQSGDQEALREFLETIRPYVIAKAKQNGIGQTEEQEEVAQDVAILVWDKIASFEHRGKYTFRSWLSRITRNVSLNRIRKRILRQSHEETVRQLGTKLQKLFTNPEHELCDLIEFHQVLWAYVKPTLKESHALVYELMWQEKLSPSEAAVRAGVSPQSAANIKARVYAKIKNLAWSRFGIHLIEV